MSTARPATGDELAEAVRDAAPPDDPDGLTEAERRTISQRAELSAYPLATYQKGLNEACAKWCLEHPDESQEMRDELEVRIPDEVGSDVPKEVVYSTIDAAMREAVRLKNGWPDYEGWIVSRRRAERRGTQPQRARRSTAGTA